MLVEAKDVIFAPITEAISEKGRSVKISGLVFHSSMAVEKITNTRKGGDVIVNVEVGPAHRGGSGNFSIEIDVENVSRILFGPAQAEIWRRNLP